MELYLPDEFKVRGSWDSVQVWRNRADLDAYQSGELVLPVWWQEFPNGITDEGIHYLLDAGFRGTPSPISGKPSGV